jgi:hypothetical protein
LDSIHEQVRDYERDIIGDAELVELVEQEIIEEDENTREEQLDKDEINDS